MNPILTMTFLRLYTSFVETIPDKKITEFVTKKFFPRNKLNLF